MDYPYMWLGPDAERIADEIRGQQQRAIELVLAEQERLRNLPEAEDE